MNPPGKEGTTGPEIPCAPVSVFVGPVDGLIKNHNLTPPTHPGAMASLERFEVLRLIGAGGMGLVFLARDPQSATKVAVKLLKPELAVQPEAVHRFLVETRHLRRLQHPHILGILEVVERPEGPFFVTPYLEKGSLANVIKPGQPLEAAVVRRIAGQIASALQYAHSKGIIHRDLKPANILLDNEGNAFLTDFGLARTMLNDSFVDVQRGHCEGTAPYMSPALASGQAEDTRCDIYAFGALLYEILTGRPPYEGATTAEILEKVRQGAVKTIYELNPKASPDLAAMAESAMARAARDRYATMADVVADLRRIDEGHPPLGPHKQWRAPRRWPSLLHRRPLALAGAVLLSRRPLALIGSVLLVCAVAFGAHYSKWRLVVVQGFTSPDVTDWREARVGDWDADKRPEVFVVVGDQCRAFGSTGDLECLFGPPNGVLADTLHLRLVADANRDGSSDVFLSWSDGKEAHLAAYNRLKHEWMHRSIADEGPVHRLQGQQHTFFSSCQVADLKGGGENEILAEVIMPWGKPRGLYCFDAKPDTQSRTPLWQFQTAPNPLGVAVVDLDGDGHNDVLLGSAAVANGIQLDDGTDDTHCYLYAISSQGRLLWRTNMCDAYSYCSPLLVHAKGENPRIYVVVRGNPGPRKSTGLEEFGRILEMDAAGNEKRRWENRRFLSSWLVDDFNDDGHPEILVTDYQGFLHVLDLNLKPLAKECIAPGEYTNELSRVELDLLAVTNLKAKTGKQLVFRSVQVGHLSGDNVGNNLTDVVSEAFCQNTIQVWDSSLKKMAECIVAKDVKDKPRRSVQVADWDRDGIQEIVVFDKEVRVFKLKRGRY